MRHWDLFVRVNHWLVALLFFSNYFVIDDGREVHEWAGYFIAALVFGRLAWAFVGPKNARLSQFFPTTRTLLHHIQLLKQSKWQQAERRYKSHNPLGALMVIFLWVILLSCVATGYMQEMDAFWGIEWLQELHENLANVALTAITLHVSAVVATQKLSGEKQIQAMLWRR